MLFQFNFYSSLLLICFIQGFLFAVIYMWRGFKNEETHPKLFSLILIIYTVHVTSWMLGFAGWYDSRDVHTTFMFYFPWTNWLALGPLTYYYFRSLTNRNFRFQGKDWLHFIPIAITLVISLGVFILDVVLPEELPYFDNTRGSLAENGIGGLGTIEQIAAMVSIFYYFLLTLKEYRNYRNYIYENFSETSRIDYKWLRNFLYAVIIGQLIWLVFQIGNWIVPGGLSYIDNWYSYFALGLLIYYLSLAGLNDNPIKSHELAFEAFEPTFYRPPVSKISEVGAKNEEKTNQEQPTENEIDQLAKAKILNYLQNSKAYLNEDLTLSELAKPLKLHPNQLSKIINTLFGKNFNEFINSFRVEEAKAKLIDPDYAHLSILGIAYESGFRSKATFNRVFKKLTNKSPNDWKKAQKS